MRCRPRTPPSMLQVKVEPASSEENSKVGVVSLVAPVGPAVSVVWGAVVSAGPTVDVSPGLLHGAESGRLFASPE